MLTAGAGIEAVQVVLTADCNLRCDYCYQNDKKPRSMSWDTLRGALDLLRLSRCPEIAVVFLGGEPLLEFPLIRKAVAYVEERRQRHTVLRYTLITNGTLLGEEQASFLEQQGIDLRLSFDGVPESQGLRGKGTFKVLDRLLDRLRIDQPRLFTDRLTVQAVVSSSTIPHLSDSLAYFMEKGVPRIGLAPLVTHDPGWTNDMIEGLDREFGKVFVAALRRYRETGKVPLLLFRSDRATEPRHLPEGAICRAPTGRALAVDVDGQVLGCAVLAGSYQTFDAPLLSCCAESVRLGALGEPGFAERLEGYSKAARRSSLFHDKRGKHSSFGRCGECRFVGACSVCPVSIGHIPGNTDPNRMPDLGCAFNKIALGWSTLFPSSGPTGVV